MRLPNDYRKPQMLSMASNDVLHKAVKKEELRKFQ